MSLRCAGATGLAVLVLASAACMVSCSNGASSPPTSGATDAASDAVVRDVTATDAAGDDSTVDSGDDATDSSPEAMADAATGDTGGGVPEASGPEPIVLASDVPNPSFLVTDGQYLYWSDFVTTDAGTASGRVMKMAVTGGTETALAVETGKLTSGIAVDSTSVYWVDDHAMLFAAPLDGGTPVALYDAAAASTIAGDGQFVYFESSPGPSVARVPVDGGPAVVLTPADAGYPPVGIAIDATRIYFPAPAAGVILAVPKDGGTALALAENGEAGAGAYVSASNYQNVVSNGTGVYWNLYPGGPIFNGGVLAAAADGGAPLLLYSANGSAPMSVVADSANVYFLTSGAAPALMRVPVDGGAAVTLASNQFSAGITGNPGPTVAVDDTSVYWLSPPQILKIAK